MSFQDKLRLRRYKRAITAACIVYIGTMHAFKNVSVVVGGNGSIVIITVDVVIETVSALCFMYNDLNVISAMSVDNVL